MGQAGRRHGTGSRNAQCVIRWARNRVKQILNIASSTSPTLFQPCTRPLHDPVQERDPSP